MRRKTIITNIKCCTHIVQMMLRVDEVVPVVFVVKVVAVVNILDKIW
jgi:hypothetical protein